MLGIRLIPILFLLSSNAQTQEAGQGIFNSTCAACHGLDGRGGEHAPNIATDPRAKGLADRDLQRIVQNGIPSAGMPGFASSLGKQRIEAVIGYLRTLQGQGPALKVSGDSEHGRQLFFGEAGCSSCHAVAGPGGFLGGDLSSYGETHTASEIRSAIVDPDKNVDSRRRVVTVVTRSGVKHSGAIRNEDNFSLQVQAADGKLLFFDKSGVLRIERAQKSVMPSDYESRLGSKGIDDIVSYLLKSAANISAAPKEDEHE